MKAYLHIGAGKTGTSAIQVALAQNRKALAEAGICYPDVPEGADDRAARGEISSGNARALAWLCNPNIAGKDFTRDGVLRWLDDTIRGARDQDLLFSSEAMQSVRPEQAKNLLKIFSDAGYEPQIIYYVRHVLDHAIAEYLQHVKMGFATLPDRDQISNLRDFLHQHRCRFLRALRMFSVELPSSAIHVRLYDAERSHLVEGFLRILGADIRLAGAAPTRIVNRSPTPEELPLFEALARMEDGTRLCRALSELLLNSPTSSDTRFSVTPEEFERFSRRNQDVVDEINASWLTGPEKLTMSSPRIQIGNAAVLSVSELATQFAETTALLLRLQIRQRNRAKGLRRAEGPVPANAAGRVRTRNER